MKADNRVSVVVPNYNGIAFVERCFKALIKDAPKAELLLVDNGSTDGSRELTARRFPQVRIIALKENYGFCRAANEGMKAASSPYVILLNNDTEVLPGFTKALVSALQLEPRAFSAGAKMIQLHHPEKIDDAGNFYCALGWAFARGKDKSVEYYEEPDEIFAACGGAVIYRKAVLERIGYLDESHFAYLEDIDLGWRAKTAGWKNIYAPEAKVLHVGSGTSGSRYNEFKVSLSSRNSIYLAYKNMPALQLFINLPFLLAGFGIKYLFFVKKGFGKTYRKGLKEGLLMCRREKKVKFCWKNLPCYGKIQLELWMNIGKRFR
ncbi:MAG: glycosyltransferase family 2 protein [Lachnospiraceae bacterium]|jgi:GT2 family glycosyltransferase|uniref:glycosyltransferase family 2 protein n=1 Tax=Candidatus Merdisoma sp. JLR.KK011 TaxID=3114299 RepID=UPI0029D4AE7A|nr:glycosyltransferase family 2 protein [Lachnospiraceae bacterium]MCI9621873.1 glycosyltransferase family 2 protein [Lachnospiraceae bacterium]